MLVGWYPRAVTMSAGEVAKVRWLVEQVLVASQDAKDNLASWAVMVRWYLCSGSGDGDVDRGRVQCVGPRLVSLKVKRTLRGGASRAAKTEVSRIANHQLLVTF